MKVDTSQFPKARYRDYCFSNRSLLEFMVSGDLANSGNVPTSY
jgi:hypothetical protein